MKLNSDGSVREGAASAGGIIRNHLGQWIGGFSMNIGPATVSDSELWGLRQGLLLALHRGFKQVAVELDSAEVVQALDLEKPLTPPAPALLIDCRGLLHKLESFTVQLIPREANQAADFMARLGHSIAPGVLVHDNAPLGLLNIICDDFSGHVP